MTIFNASTIPSPELAALLNSGKVWRPRGPSQLPTAATGHARLDAALPGGGWPKAALSEVLHAEPGSGELTLALPLVARLTQADKHVAFIAPPLLPYAPGLLQHGVVLERLLVVEPNNSQAQRKASARDMASERLWASEQLLRAGYAAVLVWADAANAEALRRLQLAAEDAGGVAILFRSLRRAAESSPAALRLAVRRTQDHAQVQVLKSRGQAPVRAIALAA